MTTDQKNEKQEEESCPTTAQCESTVVDNPWKMMVVNVTNSSEGEEVEYDYDYELDESLSTYNWAELG